MAASAVAGVSTRLAVAIATATARFRLMVMVLLLREAEAEDGMKLDAVRCHARLAMAVVEVADPADADGAMRIAHRAAGRVARKERLADVANLGLEARCRDAAGISQLGDHGPTGAVGDDE